MKAKNKDTKGIWPDQTKSSRRPSYYFHADEDFREDRDWKKNQVVDATGQKKPPETAP